MESFGSRDFLPHTVFSNVSLTLSPFECRRCLGKVIMLVVQSPCCSGRPLVCTCTVLSCQYCLHTLATSLASPTLGWTLLRANETTARVVITHRFARCVRLLRRECVLLRPKSSQLVESLNVSSSQSFRDNLNQNIDAMSTFTRIAEGSSASIDVGLVKRVSKINDNIYGGFLE